MLLHVVLNLRKKSVDLKITETSTLIHGFTHACKVIGFVALFCDFFVFFIDLSTETEDMNHKNGWPHNILFCCHQKKYSFFAAIMV